MTNAGLEERLQKELGENADHGPRYLSQESAWRIGC